ncbi:short-chain dehydrogenase, partial [Streptomyces pratensis]
RGVRVRGGAPSVFPLPPPPDPALDGRTGLVIGPGGAVDETLLAYVTPGLNEAVRVWTAGLLATAGQAS